MRSSSSRHAALLLTVCTMLAVACSRVPPGGEITIGGVQPGTGSEGEGVDGTGFGPVVAGTGATDGAGSTTSGSTAFGGTSGGSTTSGSTTGSGTSGGTTTGSSTDGSSTGTDGSSPDVPPPPTAGQTGPGIDGRTIKVVWADHFEDCPDQPNEPRDDVREKGKLVLTEYVKFYNEYVLKEFGWKFDLTIVDHGGYFCPERQRAAGLKIAKEIQPFAVLGPSSTAQGPLLADIVTRAGILHIGGNWKTTAGERARHPYAWNVFATPEVNLRFLVDWMAKRIKGTTVPDRVTGTGLEVDRVYGILGIDDGPGQELAAITRDMLLAKGFEIGGIYLTSADAGVTAQQAPSTVAKMKDDGINTLVFGVDGNGNWPVAFTNAMDVQRYYPDIMVGTYGNSFFDQLSNKNVWQHVKGTSPAAAIALRVETDSAGNAHPDFVDINENSSAYQKAWKELGHSDNPQNGTYPTGFGSWANLAMLATGVIHAGDTLNAHTFAEGLESAGSPGSPNRCTVGRLMGRDYKHVASFDWNAAHDGGVIGWTPIYWVNRPNGLSSGYYESYDNYVFFKTSAELPPAATHDTGQKPFDIKKQEQIGIHPWTSCSEFPNYPTG